MNSTTSNSQFIRFINEQNYHIDSRNIIQKRPIKFTYTRPSNTSLISNYKSGNTSIKIFINANIRSPYKNKGHLGILKISILNKNNFTIFNDSQETDYIIRKNQLENFTFDSIVKNTLKKALETSYLVDLENLCLIGNQKVWEINIKIIQSNNDGNFLENAFEATILSLKKFSIPQWKIIDKEIFLFDENEKKPFFICEKYLSDSFNKGINLNISFKNKKENYNQNNEIEEGEIIDKNNINIIRDCNLSEESFCEGFLFTFWKNNESLNYSKLISDNGLEIHEFLDLFNISKEISENN